MQAKHKTFLSELWLEEGWSPGKIGAIIGARKRKNLEISSRIGKVQRKGGIS
jgi:hypothetical protein